MSATVMLVHGQWHSSACWDLVVPGLEDQGVSTVALDLPSVGGPTGAVFGDYDEDVAAVRTALDGHPVGSVVLVGHSRGGIVIGEAGDHPAVSDLVFLAAFMAEPGEDLSDLLVDGADNLTLLGNRPEADGPYSAFDPELAEATFYHDAPPDRVATAIGQLRRQCTTFGIPAEPVCAWHLRPTTYCVCTEDRTLSPVVQRRWAARVERAVEWPTSHSPFLSRPELVVDLLADLARLPPRS